MGISAGEFLKWLEIYQVPTGGSPPPLGALLGVNNLSDVQSRPASVSNLQLTVGVYTQAYSPLLDNFANVALNPNDIPYWTGPSGFGSLPTSADARSLLTKTYAAMVIALGVLPLTGGAMAGGILLPLGEPSQDRSAVTKIYVDDAVANVGFGFLKTTLNLQDLTNVAQARVNLGLGDLSTQNTLSFNGSVSGAGGVGGITLTLNPSVVATSNLQNYAVTLGKIQTLNPKTLLGNSDNAISGAEQISFSTFAQTSLALSDMNATSARFNLGLKQAALKDVTDDSQIKVASVTGSFQVGNVLVANDVDGTVKDGGALGLLAFQSTINIQGAVQGSGTSTIVTNIPDSSITLTKISQIPANSLVANPTASPANPTTIPASTFVLRNGDTMTGGLLLDANPTQPLGAATKQYVDSSVLGFASLSGATFAGTVYLNGDQLSAPNAAATKAYVDSAISGSNVHEPVQLVSTTNLIATYSNGSAGVGATLTNAWTWEPLVLDGAPVSLNKRVLLPNQFPATYQNGIYVAIDVGSFSSPWILMRAQDYDSVPEVSAGDTVTVTQGDTKSTTTWMQYSTVTNIGTDPIQFVQTSVNPGSLGTAAFKNASNVSSNFVVSTSGLITVGNFAVFTDVNGTVGNGGAPGPFATASSINFSGGDASGSGSPLAPIVLTIGNDAVTTAKIQNSAITLAKFQNINPGSFLANTTGSLAAPQQIPLTFILQSSNNLSDVLNPTSARTNIGCGTAATKAASDVTRNNVASVLGPVAVNNFAVYADSSGTVKDGGTPGLGAFVNSLSFGGGGISGGGAINGTVSLSIDPSSVTSSQIQNNAISSTKIANNAVTLAKIETIPSNTFLANISGLTAAPVAVNTNIFIRQISAVRFTSSGTYTKPANLLYAKVTCIGSGAGGAGSSNTGGPTASCGGGGGGGNKTVKWLTADQIGSSVSVTIPAGGSAGAVGGNGGNGGACLFGVLCIANGGLGGQTGATANSVVATPGSPGSLGTIGDFFEYGGYGERGVAVGGGNGYSMGGNGGIGAGGGWGGLGGSNAPGNAGTANSGAGGGGGAGNSGTAGQTAGAGGSGCCEVEQYLGA